MCDNIVIYLQISIRLENIRKCYTQRSGIFILEEFSEYLLCEVGMKGEGPRPAPNLLEKLKQVRFHQTRRFASAVLDGVPHLWCA